MKNGQAFRPDILNRRTITLAMVILLFSILFAGCLVSEDPTELQGTESISISTEDSCNQENVEIPETTEHSIEEIQFLLEQHARILEDKYGVSILVGNQCTTAFTHFTASHALDYEKVRSVLDTLDYILGRYPEGFFRQLCTDQRSGLRIHLIQNLWANNEDLYGDSYGGFSQDLLDHYILVLDIDDTWEELYYHELSHIIEMHLALDAASRPDALFSEAAWNALNPDWFTGYDDDYRNLPELVEDGWFVDPYGAINASEDRAQIMAKAMLPNYRIYFSNNHGIRAKMEYYSMAIQDAFDTEGWPEILPWEENYKK